MSDEPSPADSNGRRDSKGRFGPGNRAGKGNPFAKKAQAIRAALFKGVKPSDIREAVKSLMQAAKDGDRMALAEILDRTIGTAVPSDIQTQLEELREQVDRILRERE